MSKPNGVVKSSSDVESKSEPPAVVERRAMFVAIDAAERALATKRAEVEAAEQAVSMAVKALHTKFGKGPYRRNGQTLTAICRPNRKTGTETYFLRGSSDDALEV